jgi:hypothetical protein
VNESTVRSILKVYNVEIRRKQREEDGDVEVRELPAKKRGRSLLLGDVLDSKVQAYLKKIRESGGVVSARIAIAAAKGLVMVYDRRKLAEYGGPILLNRHWAYSLLKRMKFVKRKAK